MHSTIGSTFNGRRNSLNVMRLVLAASVIISHAWPLGQYGAEPRIGHTTFGTLAVACFFAISGFLITASRERTPGWRYVWHRGLRILPGYWVCLIVIAAVIAPLAWLHYNGTLAGYPVLDALRYVGVNLGLKTNIVPTIPGTEESIDPEFQVWNGAAWSLFFEFLCYIAVAILAALRLLKAPVVLTILIGGSALLLAWELFPSVMEPVLFRSYDAFRLVTTGTIFAGGSLLWMWRDRIRHSAWLAAGAAAVTVVGLVFLRHPEWLIAVPIAYLIIWLGTELPFHNLAMKTDVSYGIYIYGYPVATILTIWGVNQWGWFAYVGLTFVIVVPLAFASWYGVEKRALSLKNIGWGRRRPLPADMQVPAAADPEPAPVADSPSPDRR